MSIIPALRRMTEAKGLRVQVHFGLHSKFQASLDYTVRPYLKNKKRQRHESCYIFFMVKIHFLDV
jgi:hypothetical protein